MRSLWIIVLVVVTVLGITSVASASMRDEVGSLVDTVAGLTADDGDIPDEPPAVDDGPPWRAGKDPSGDGTCAATRAQNGHTWRVGEPQNHGAVVSAVARSKDGTAQNHGAAVSAVAKSQAGKKDK
jgi:hypothetical protein